MFDLRLDEVPLPASKSNRNNLIAWIIDTLCNFKEGEKKSADDGTFFSIHRILADCLLNEPQKASETRV